MSKRFFWLLTLFYLSPIARAETILTLEEYLQKVAAQNTGMKAAVEKKNAAEARTGQAELLTQAQVFGEINQARDKSPVLMPGFNGINRGQESYKFGLRQQWDSGLKSEAYLVEDAQDMAGAYAMLPSSMDLRRRGLTFGVEMPLLKNGLGRETLLQKSALTAMAAGDRALAEVDKTQRLVEAHQLYIRLARAQESLKIQSDLVRQGKKLVDWVQKQVRDRLLDAVHLAQAEVAWEARKQGEANRALELRTLTRQFHSLLESKDESTPPQLQRLSQIEASMPVPERLHARQDLFAQEQYLQAEKAQISLDREGVKPELAVKAQYALYAKVSERGDTSRCDNPTNCSTLALSLAFSMPLGTDTTQQITRGLIARTQAKDLEIQRLRIDADRDAKVIQDQIFGLGEQIRILLQLIAASEKRLQFERQRQGSGRASTFDLIQAEQELFEAKDKLLEAQAARLQLIAQLKIYEART